MKKYIIVFAVLLIIAAVIYFAAVLPGQGITPEPRSYIVQSTASSIATAINAYNHLHFKTPITSIGTYEEFKARVGNLFPSGVPETDFNDALEWIMLEDGRASIKPLVTPLTP